ncbi:quinone-dependent dihydroorotate dehydrogenase [Rhizobium sp. L1K21]|uniref:quinone-dependent dihydroorotate dehydrogenase n=1 Tax=Rhizobium sp. L1K21 TaxID=2954933 RepID=UPI002091E5E2|nr:quinone-dependent dihydroorotate dehydrogenase [Rhizobium sp. L1K21]MCO6187178.1 quinone-dependent dihydroorotate dehydrogenase [Rhizobium sp. L1K21]
MSLISTFARKALFTLDPETAHGVSISGLKSGLLPVCGPKPDPRLAVDVAGLHFENPLGLAAGYDKNAQVPAEILKLGFGFTEVGTLTPKPQDGNPKPRLFRLTQDMAVINRMGFNNEGHAAALARLKRLNKALMVGVNIGANKDSEDRVADYVAGIRTFYSVARYFTANISSPNTPGLRNLQDRESLDALLSAVLGARDEEAAKAGKTVPVFLKIAPDMTEGGLDDIAEVALARKLDGLIVSNTTLKRDGLSDTKLAGEAGGLSGKPLFALSTTVLAKMRKRVGKDMPIIGAGGVHDAETAAEKIRAGADLVQLYSCMVYEGPTLPGAIVRGLSSLADREGLSAISVLRDTKTDQWAQGNI